MIVRRDRRSSDGFALPLAMFTIAVVAMIFAGMSQQTRTTARLVADVTARQSSQVVEFSVEQTLIYLIATSPVDGAGLHFGADPIGLDAVAGGANTPSNATWLSPLDATPCNISVGSRAMTVRIQDAAGLVNLNTSTYDVLKRLFITSGVDAEKSGPLAERLLDYIEYKTSGDLRRLNGASANDYVRAGMPPPTNSPLRSVSEARAIFGFASEKALWAKGGLMELATTQGEGYVNPNTASSPVLRIAFGLSAEGAGRVVALRKSSPVRSLAQLESLSGEPVSGGDDFLFPSVPGGNVRLEIADADLQLRWILTLVLTPEGKVAPYEVRERYVASHSEEHSTRLPDEVASCTTIRGLED